MDGGSAWSADSGSLESAKPLTIYEAGHQNREQSSGGATGRACGEPHAGLG